MCWNFVVLSQNHSQLDSIYAAKLTGDIFVEKKCQGSPFVTPEWANSTIVLSTGDTIVGEKIKYNGYLDEVIWLNPSNFKKFKLDKPNINEFWIQPDSYHSTHYKQISVPIPDNQKIFLETTYEGNLALYIYRKINRSGTTIERYEDIIYELDILTPKDIYFFKLPDGRWIQMNKLRLRYLLKYFPEHKKAITQLAKKSHLNFSSEDQCIELTHLIDKEILTTNK
jgi:hypothetical protein